MTTNVNVALFFSVGRKILTKRAGANDDVGDTDAEDVTSLYKNPEGINRQRDLGDECFLTLFKTKQHYNC